MKKIIAIVLLTFSIIGCEDLSELNKVTKNAASVEAGSLFASSTVSLFDLMTDISVNRNIFRYMAQHWTATTYTDEANYNLDGRDINGYVFNEIYSDVVRDAREAAALVQENTNLPEASKNAQLAAIEIVQIYGMSVLVDVFGDVPYSEAFSQLAAEGEAEFTPVYDDDAAIYADLLARLSTAIGNLQGDGDDNGMGEFDLVYGGNVLSWKKFGNSLKLHLAVRIADVDPGAAKTAGEQAIANGLMESSADDYELSYQSSPPHTNPIYDYIFIAGRNTDNIASNTLVDMMNTMDDPRREFFFAEQFVVDTVSGELSYLGGTYGASNSFALFSKPGEKLMDPTFPGTILSYTEVEFLLADAAERGWTGAGDAETHYNAAIANSHAEWGVDEAMADEYLARPDVAYTTAAGDWKTKIGTQKWLAMYNQGFEAWTTYRMYDTPSLNLAANSELETPRRYTYPQDEYSLNQTNVQAASGSIGGDNLDTKIFWDAN